MNKRAKDRTGVRYSKLTALNCVSERPTRWLCKCDCGNQIVVRGGNLQSGATRSCGCLFKEINHTHSMSYSREYSSYRSMKQRCYTKTATGYDRYGGKGIQVCDRWLESFENFYADMGDRPEGASLDRINNEGDYSPENCRWASRTTQARNSRVAKLNIFQVCNIKWLASTGLMQKEIAKRYGVSGTTIHKKIVGKNFKGVQYANTHTSL